MANSPVPRPTMNYRLPVTVEGSLAYQFEHQYTYYITIENNSEFHCFFGLSAYIKDTEEGAMLGIQEVRDSEQFFNEEVIAPGAKRQASLISEKEITDFANYTWYGQGYDQVDTDVTFDNLAIVEDTSRNYANGNAHYYKLTGNAHNLKDYYYSYVIDLNYKDVEHSILTSTNGNFSLLEALDLSQISIKKVTVYRSANPAYHSKIGNWLLVIAIVFAVGFFLMIGAAIALPIIFTSIRRKRKRRQISNQVNQSK